MIQSDERLRLSSDSMNLVQRLNLNGWILAVLCLSLAGCATLFGWNIHASGVLSEDFYAQIEPVSARVAVYLPSSFLTYESRNRGGRFADPQTYYVGESMTPMAVEAFGRAFEEFVFIEAEPTDQILKRYEIDFLVFLQIKSLQNHVTLKGQALEIITDVQVVDSEGELLTRAEARGSSEAQKIFAKKGGPEVNLNAAIENNLRVTVQLLQDFVRSRRRVP